MGNVSNLLLDTALCYLNKVKYHIKRIHIIALRSKYKYGSFNMWKSYFEKEFYTSLRDVELKLFYKLTYIRKCNSTALTNE